MNLLWQFAVFFIFMDSYCESIILPLQSMTDKEIMHRARLYREDYRARKKPVNLTYMRISNFLSKDLFYSTILIGTYKQLFRVVIDSQSTLMWVPLKTSGHGFQCGAHLHNMYNPDISDKSSLLHNTFNFVKANVQYSGKVYQDVVYVSQHELQSQAFGVLEYTDSQYYEHAPFDGVFPTGIRRSMDDITPPMRRMLSNKQISRDIWAIGINTTNKNPQQGVLIMGDEDLERILKENTKPNYHRIKNYEGYLRWHLYPEFMWVGETKLWQYEADAIPIFFDTSAPKIYAPQALAYLINTNMGAVRKYIGFPIYEYAWELECSNFYRGNTPDISFTLHKRYYSLTSEYLITKFRQKGRFACITNVEGDRFTKVITFGTPFFKTYFAIFDKGGESIGITPNSNYLERPH